MGFVATFTLIMKIIKYFINLDDPNNPRPPIVPSNDPIDINPALILDDSLCLLQLIEVGKEKVQ
jgi:hypothetical protein